jgi:hypothetical protein
VARSGDAEDGDSVSVDEERFSGVESSSERRGNFRDRGCRLGGGTGKGFMIGIELFLFV